MLLKDQNKDEEEVALLERSSSFDDSTTNFFSDQAEGEPLASSSTSTHTTSSPPSYYPPSPFTFPLSSAQPRPIPTSHSAHVSHNIDEGNVVISHVLNLNVSMPPLLAYPQGHMTDTRKKESINGYFRSARGRLDLRLGFVGREDDDVEEDGQAGSSSTMVASRNSKDRVKVVAISYERMKVEAISRTPSTLPISLHLTSRSSITLVLPRSFRGPVHLINASRSKVVLSSQLQQAFTHISSEPPISFIGSLAGWSGASPTEEDNASSKEASTSEGGGLKEVRLDELWIDPQGSGGKISISYVGEDEEERMAREVSGGGAIGDGRRKRRGGFWRALGGCCCSCSSEDYQN